MTSFWSWPGRRLPVAGRWSLRVQGLGLELGAQPPGLPLGAAHPPLGALGTADSAANREQPPHRALLDGVREPSAVHVGG